MTYQRKIIVLFATVFMVFIFINIAIAQTLPVASDVSIDSGAVSIALTEGATKNVVCRATVIDVDGCAELTGVSAVLYRTNVSGGAGAADDNNDHYSTNCVVDTCTGTDATYTCTFPVYYYADPTDAGTHSGTNWTCQVTPSDGAGAGTTATDTIEMASLAALDVDNTINYGELALDADTGSSNQQTTITNTGNVRIDISLDGYGASNGDGKSMACDGGSVAIGNEEYSGSGFTYGGGTDLTDSAVELDLDVPQRTNDASPSTKEVYWGFGMPANGVSGSCSGTVVFTAVDDIVTDYVVFDANGGTGTMANQKIAFGDTANLTANGFTKTGYTFAGWNTAVNGSGTAYNDQASFTMAVARANTLYAQWTINTYTVTYNGNTSTGGSVPVDGSSPYNYNSSVTVLENTGTLVKTGYTFDGWNTEAGGGGTDYAPAATFSITTDTVLYAKWTENPFVCGTSQVTFDYNGSSVTYETVNNPNTTECWLARNLGATRVAQFSTDSLAYGDLFQWGRLDDGHQVRTSGTTPTNSSGDVPGHSNFILEPNSPFDWRDPQETSLWQGVAGINNPCPTGFRLPTEAEWEAERSSWGSNNSAGAFDSPLRLTVAGYRYYNNGSLDNVGVYGYYWSSTVDGTNSRNLDFGSGMCFNGRAYGFAVRCLKD